MHTATNITATVKIVPHPDPSRLVDIWARLVVKELVARDQENEVIK